MCDTCNEFAEEKEPIKIEEIRTYDNGIFGYKTEILFCPTCGMKIEYGKKAED